MQLPNDDFISRAFRLFLFALTVILVFTVPQTSARAANPKPAGPVLSFSADVGGGEATSKDRIKFNFGAVNLTDGGVVKHAIVLVNPNKTPLTIKSIEPNCDCVSLKIEGEKTLPIAVAPGKKIAVDCSVDLSRLYPGLFNKLIYVFVEEQPAVAATIELTGSIKTGATFTSEIAQFGTVLYGEQPSVELAAQIDGRIAKDPERIEAKSSNPDVFIEKTGETKLAEDIVEVKFAAKLSSSPVIGALSGNVSLVYKNPSGESIVLGEPVKILGEVMGSISAYPKSADFYGSGANYPLARQIIVTGLNPADIAKTKLDSSSPYIRATLLPPGESSRVNACKLQIEIDRNIPVGAYQGSVTLTSPGGERIVTPVAIQITGAASK